MSKEVNYWVKADDDFYHCKFCGNEAYWDTDYGQQLFDYCPYCGKRMKFNLKATNLEGKCGSCKWAKPRHGTYIDCVCPQKKPNWFARTNRACKHYEQFS